MLANEGFLNESLRSTSLDGFQITSSMHAIYSDEVVTSFEKEDVCKNCLKILLGIKNVNKLSFIPKNKKSEILSHALSLKNLQKKERRKGEEKNM